jgi:hypothetical protein
MARKFKRHHLHELEAKMDEIGIRECRDLPQIKKDLAKVEFDFENWDCDNGCKYINGFHVAPNGLPYWGDCAGGDWEIPIFYIIYWDGKKLRAYIPTEGNPWNTDTKSAYGNAPDYVLDANGRMQFLDGTPNADQANLKKRWPELFKGVAAVDIESDDSPRCDPILILKDIIGRILPR